MPQCVVHVLHLKSPSYISRTSMINMVEDFVGCLDLIASIKLRKQSALRFKPIRREEMTAVIIGLDLTYCKETSS